MVSEQPEGSVIRTNRNALRIEAIYCIEIYVLPCDIGFVGANSVASPVCCILESIWGFRWTVGYTSSIDVVLEQE